MKKLMIAAAAAAMIVGVQADELCEESVAGAGCSVYNVKFTFKTISGKKRNCAAYLVEGDWTQGVPEGVWTRYMSVRPVPAAYDAAPVAAQPQLNSGLGPNPGALVTKAYYDLWVAAGEPTSAAGGSFDPWAQRIPGHSEATQAAAVWYGDLYWADNGTRTLEGILWQCAASCFEGNAVWNGKGSGEIYFALWEKKTQKVFSYPVFRYYKNANRDTFNWITEDETGAFNWMGRYGAKAEKIGVAWAPTLKDYTFDGIQAVGFGTFDVKALHMKSVTGGAVAQLEPFVNGEEDQCGNGTFKIQVAYVCEEFKAWCCDPCYAAVDWVPAYGNWSLKYNASLSKGKTPLSKVLPAYAVFSATGDAAFTNGYDTKGIFHEYDAAFAPVGAPTAGFYADYYADLAATQVAGTAVAAAGTWIARPAVPGINMVVTAGQANSRGLDL